MGGGGVGQQWRHRKEETHLPLPCLSYVTHLSQGAGGDSSTSGPKLQLSSGDPGRGAPATTARQPEAAMSHGPPNRPIGPANTTHSRLLKRLDHAPGAPTASSRRRPPPPFSHARAEPSPRLSFCLRAFRFFLEPWSRVSFLFFLNCGSAAVSQGGFRATALFQKELYTHEKDQLKYPQNPSRDNKFEKLQV